ncbi:leucyl aminopeptidase [Rhizobium oryzicola]|uniref:Probable cytosol aminopeptidase n=1 Tax=Rhizobium oryzicola TaxID=1232668 RepID=A0ABT8SUH6_9HYPH|nr:leucyl aminopeptidase [Rhizobium oryzicola]MDO1581703.1 leucyl aminopeptidase [Rhizobium oryzicola]
MSASYSITFSPSAPAAGALAVLLKLSGDHTPAGASFADPGQVLTRAAEISAFSGKSMSSLEVVAPHQSPFDRIAVIGLGKPADLKAYDWLRAGGKAASVIKSATNVVVAIDADGVDVDGAKAADVALGLLLRAYRFDRFKTKKADDDDTDAKTVSVTIVTAAHEAAAAAFEAGRAVADGVNLARELVNLPPNILGPVEFAEKARGLTALGVDVEILTETEMRELGMGALLGVAQGSVRPPRLAIMRWNGGKQGEAPLAFIGKGVVFDTGGISIKPAAGMEDMKGDMGGAAAVTGLLHALAARKAKVNAVGIIGLVENMPDGNAQRPGDIVTSMSGQTIEIINTDAEGRLVLADALWYCKETVKPRLMIDLATLTGAIMVALGNLHAGLFSNDDALAVHLTAAGEESGEKLWRMPLGKDYDKIIDSKFADMKNSGGRYGGSITAAQFLKRFVGDTPWAHLDIAGTAMNSPSNEINQSWGSGYGVRLLDQFVRQNYEG